jgi:hypothetical protein
MDGAILLTVVYYLGTILPILKPRNKNKKCGAILLVQAIYLARRCIKRLLVHGEPIPPHIIYIYIIHSTNILIFRYIIVIRVIY